jgi:hypothetical protein
LEAYSAPISSSAQWVKAEAGPIWLPDKVVDFSGRHPPLAASILEAVGWGSVRTFHRWAAVAVCSRSARHSILEAWPAFTAHGLD